MSKVPVTFIYQSPVEDTSPAACGYRGHEHFVAALLQQPQISLQFVLGKLAEISRVELGYIIFDGIDAGVALLSCNVETRSEIASRMIPINASRPRIFQKLLEKYALAGAIDGMSMAEWESVNSEGAHGLFGRKDIAARIGAVPDFLESERYAYLKSSTHHGLPHLVADYICALSAARDSAPSTAA